MMDIDLPRRWLEVHGPLNKVSSANVILDEDAETLAVWGSASFDDDSIVVYLTYRVGAMMMLCGPKKGVEEIDKVNMPKNAPDSFAPGGKK